MKHNIVLTVTFLLSLLFISFHFTQDVMRQAEGANTYPIPVIIFALWVYGTLMLSDRVWGYIIMFFGGLFAAGMIIIHSKGIVVGKSGSFFFLSARGLWTKFHSRRAAQRATTSRV